MPEARHGGEVFKIARQLGCEPSELTDFSANINPLGPPPVARNVLKSWPELAVHYPEERNPDLLKALAARSSVNSDQVILGNGATELLYSLFHFLKPQKVLLPIPTFSELARACAITGATAIEVPFLRARKGVFKPDWAELEQRVCGEQADLMILVTPNNPTGITLDWQAAEPTLSAAKRHGTRILVDESFIDFSPDATWSSALESQSLFILRSLTKFYAIPGLRLGYLLANAEDLARMQEQRIPWQVNQVVQCMALEFLRLADFEDRTRKLNHQELLRLSRKLGRIEGLTPYPSRANFILVQLDARKGQVSTLSNHLLQHKILIRDCQDWPGLPGHCFRVAVRKRTDNNRLLCALKEVW